jgi:hypothetical protein
LKRTSERERERETRDKTNTKRTKRWWTKSEKGQKR